MDNETLVVKFRKLVARHNELIGRYNALEQRVEVLEDLPVAKIGKRARAAVAGAQGEE